MSNHVHRLPNYKQKVCEKCGKEFSPTTSTQIFCSKQCSGKEPKTKPDENGYFKCRECGEPYKKEINNQMYCRSCRPRNYYVPKTQRNIKIDDRYLDDRIIDPNNPGPGILSYYSPF